MKGRGVWGAGGGGSSELRAFLQMSDECRQLVAFSYCPSLVIYMPMHIMGLFIKQQQQ